MPSAARGGKNSNETGRVVARMSFIFKLDIQWLLTLFSSQQPLYLQAEFVAEDRKMDLGTNLNHSMDTAITEPAGLNDEESG